MFLPPLITGTGCTVRCALHPAKERIVKLTNAIAAPDVCLVIVDFVMERVVDGYVGAGHFVDGLHDPLEVGTVAAIAFAYVQNETVGVYHLVLQYDVFM